MAILDEKQIYNLWVKAWNDDVSVLDNITDPHCLVHQVRTDGRTSDERKGAHALKGIITDGCAFFNNVKMTIEVGPIVDRPYVSARWKFTGVYNGGMPGAKAEMGKKISFNGTDIFLVQEGKIKDYWVSSDGIYLMEQLGVF
ncbi:ester cyclase [Halobacillus naozhouensis]|uniref:Ester cyclase n=1 Tax=Halobacillus naozhouensis TaxID=554880 RepID=A0ABY8J4Z8_9BACI|nr:ester cyclase [Halobacillus naozhouensis]WFT76508.1 ester cyclase [Halobacillus naozhouensis]